MSNQTVEEYLRTLNTEKQKQIYQQFYIAACFSNTDSRQGIIYPRYLKCLRKIFQLDCQTVLTWEEECKQRIDIISEMLNNLKEKNSIVL